MGFEPTTLRDLVGVVVFHVVFLLYCISCCISIKGSLGGWMVASLICLNVTARCSYESYTCIDLTM